MNATGPVERVTVARYDDDYPFSWGAGAQQAVAEDLSSAAAAGTPDGRHGAAAPQRGTIQVDLLDAWLKP